MVETPSPPDIQRKQDKMILKRLSGNTAEVVRVEFKVAESTGSITANSPVCYHVDGSSADGISGGQPAAANLKAWAGVAVRTVAINGYGQATIWGYVSSVKLSNEGSDVTINAGDAMFPIAGTNLGVSSVGGSTLSYLNMKYGIICESVNASNSQYVKINMRAL